MKKIVLGGVGAAALLAISPAIAQVAPVAPLAPTPIAKAHTRADAVAHVQQMFARLDTNRDGFIVKAEADAARGAMHAQRMAQRGQRMANRGPRDGSMAFDRLDANKDGAISRAEFDAMRQQRIARRDRDGDGRPDARRMGMRRMGGMGGGMGALHGRMFELADANRDGRVSLQEATTAAYQHFDRVDANRDGTITPAERQQFRQQMRATRQRG